MKKEEVICCKPSKKWVEQIERVNYKDISAINQG